MFDGGNVVVVLVDVVEVVVVTPVILNMTIFESSKPIPVTFTSTLISENGDNCVGSRTKVPTCLGGIDSGKEIMSTLCPLTKNFRFPPFTATSPAFLI